MGSRFHLKQEAVHTVRASLRVCTVLLFLNRAHKPVIHFFRVRPRPKTTSPDRVGSSS
jgi:hypothetical protein